MKPIVPTRYLILLLIAFFAGNAQSQSIRVERVEGELRVNGEPIDVDALPEELDLGEVEFSLQSSGPFPMWVEINGTRFEIWQDRVTKADKSGPVGFKLYIGPDGTYTTIESGAPDVHGLAEMMFRQLAGMVSSAPAMELNPRQTIEFTGVVSKSQDEIVAQSAKSQEMASSVQDATRMLELSNYLANVQNTSGELFELLRHEWREEAEVAEMAGRIRALNNNAERDEAIEQLRAKLEEIFLMKQENRRMEIQHLETELERMERRLKERSRAMDRLIDARLDELLGTRQ